MATAAQLANVGGEVRVTDGLTVFVRELSVSGEIGLGNQLRMMAKKALGPAGLYANARPVLDFLREVGLHEDRAALLEITGRLIVTGAGVDADAVNEFRRTPAGVAEELFWRTRQTSPDATRDELVAVVNVVNALDVFLQIQEAISPKKTATTPNISPGSS